MNNLPQETIERITDILNDTVDPRVTEEEVKVEVQNYSPLSFVDPEDVDPEEVANWIINTVYTSN